MAKGLRGRVGKQYTGTQRTRCAVKAQCKNAAMPWGLQGPHEPLELSLAGHLAR